MARSVLACVVSALSLLLVACGGGSEPTYEGQWVVDRDAMKAETETSLKKELSGIAEDLVQQQIDAARAAIDQTQTSLRLNPGGTYSFVATFGNQAQTRNGTWKAEGSGIVLTTPGQPDIKARIKDGKLLIENPSGTGPANTVLVRGNG